MKKIKLRMWVKVVLIILIFVLIVLSIKNIVKDYNEKAKNCDAARGYTCSYYDIRQFAIRGN